MKMMIQKNIEDLETAIINTFKYVDTIVKLDESGKPIRIDEDSIKIIEQENSRMTSILKKNPKYPAALKIARTLKKAGYRVLFAGGCVRDALLDIPSQDIDITTSAPPAVIQHLFPKTLEIGVQFGVIMVIWKDLPFEVATFRKDLSYSDGRRPDAVTYTDEKEDALRRDFTVNGLFWDPFEEKVLDYVKGREDLERKIIRTIGRPEDRFEEDKLRLLRAIRFSAQLDFSIESQTAEAIRRMAPAIQLVSRERIREEVFKILAMPRPGRYLKQMRDLGLWEPVFPFLYYPENLQLLDALPSTLAAEFKLASLCWKEAPFLEKKIIEDFRLSNREKELLYQILKLLKNFETLQELRLAERKKIFRNENFPHLLVFFKEWERIFRDPQTPISAEMEKQYSQYRDSLSLPRLISGEDLKQMGLSPSPVFREILEEVENMQLEGQIKTREEALKTAETLKENYESQYR